MKQKIFILIICLLFVSCNNNNGAKYIKTNIGYWIISDKEAMKDKIGTNHYLWLRNKREIIVINVENYWYNKFNIGDSVLFFQHNKIIKENISKDE